MSDRARLCRSSCLVLDAEMVRPVLEASAEEQSLAGLSAEMVLREFDAGRLHFDYGKPAR